MFNSIGNNFGAGQITFKDYQAENYVVLNSKFTFDPTNADYQACDQLEIYVPDLTIDRSAVGGVFIRFVEDYHYSWGDSVYDGGTVLKSWIKDKNTIVIEKQPWRPAHHLYRHALPAVESRWEYHQEHHAAPYDDHGRQLPALWIRDLYGGV